MGLALEHTCSYPFASDLVEEGPRQARLKLAASPRSTVAPPFFVGSVARPAEAARLLRLVGRTAARRFHVPSAMLARLILAADPVVTSGGGFLRFEAFSLCAGVYARLDFQPDAFGASRACPGTTNVDFSPATQAALARVRTDTRLDLAVGSEHLTVATGDDVSIERKTRLPVRWLKSFLEVQTVQAKMQLCFSVSPAEAARFLRGLPSQGGREAVWVVPSGRGLRLSAREATGAVRLHGVERLHDLRDLALGARAMRVYGEPGGASAWVLDFGTLVSSTVLSPERWRGFSGEGGALDALAISGRDGLVPLVRASLSWEAELQPGTLASRLGADEPAVAAALASLGARGLVGYDVSRGTWFHRVLPFDLEAVEVLHPRLLDARRLLAEGAVRILSGGEGIDAEVSGSEGVHRVHVGRDGERCTCPWHGRHRGSRGPCKHLLAVALLEGGEA